VLAVRTPLVGYTVVDIQPDRVTVKAGDGALSQYSSKTIIWAAGVTASPLAQALADGIAGGSDADATIGRARALVA